MAATRTVENVNAYTAIGGQLTLVGTGLTHYRVPYVEGLIGDDVKAAVIADEGLPDACQVTYLPDTDELQITFLEDDTPGEMEGPPEFDIIDLVEGVVDALIDLLTP